MQLIMNFSVFEVQKVVRNLVGEMKGLNYAFIGRAWGPAHKSLPCSKQIETASPLFSPTKMLGHPFEEKEHIADDVCRRGPSFELHCRR